MMYDFQRFESQAQVTLSFTSSPERLEFSEKIAVEGSSEKGKSSKRIAIVDDEEDLCSMISMLVRRQGYAIECIARSGDEIVHAIKDGKRPDVIIMDYRMPGLNGLQAAGLVRKQMPNAKIIIASADDTIRRDTLSAGLYFLSKPYSSSLLARLLEDLTGAKHQGPT